MWKIQLLLLIRFIHYMYSQNSEYCSWWPRYWRCPMTSVARRATPLRTSSSSWLLTRRCEKSQVWQCLGFYSWFFVLVGLWISCTRTTTLFNLRLLTTSASDGYFPQSLNPDSDTKVTLVFITVLSDGENDNTSIEKKGREMLKSF